MKIDFYHYSVHETINWENIWKHLNAKGIDARFVVEDPGKNLSRSLSKEGYKRIIKYMKIKGYPYIEEARTEQADAVITTQVAEWLKPYQGLKINTLYGSTLTIDCWGYSFEKLKGFDFVFAHGEYSKNRISKNGFPVEKIEIMGFPKFEEFRSGSFDKFRWQAFWGLRPEKKTIVYLPSWHRNSSIDRFIYAIADLAGKYNVLVKPHHNNIDMEGDRLHRLSNLANLIIDTETLTTVPFLLVSDILLADTRSGALAEGILADCSTIGLHYRDNEQKDIVEPILNLLFPICRDPGQLNEIIAKNEHQDHVKNRVFRKFLKPYLFTDFNGNDAETTSNRIIEIIERSRMQKVPPKKAAGLFGSRAIGSKMSEKSSQKTEHPNNPFNHTKKDNMDTPKSNSKAKIGSCLDDIIPPEIEQDEFYAVIKRLAEKENLQNVLEIGSSSGEGSTKAFFEGLRKNANQPTLYCLEISKTRFEALAKRYQNVRFVKCYQMSSVEVEKFPSEQEVVRFYRTVPTSLNKYPLKQVVEWYRQDIHYLQNNRVFQSGIDYIRQENHIDKFDMVLIDGSEFTGLAELEAVYGAKIILLDDINAFKNHLSYRKLVSDPQYRLIEENHSLRNGYAVFRRLDHEVSLQFFTIVLNGMPYIKHHINLFKSLPFDWHWHIVEGVADLRHDTSWSLQNGGRISEELHDQGLSADGTTQYLDLLVKENPEHITVYRKQKGFFWDGKIEMVNAPLQSIERSCLLWQIDADELWQKDQIIKVKSLFDKYPDKTAAFFHCHYFVGPNLVTVTPNSYSHHNEYEWLRVWRFEPGMRWLSHEPPRLAMKSGSQWIDTARINPFKHEETSQEGLVFTHYAYATEPQLRFKEIYYGYKNAVSQWRKLQRAKKLPVYLRDYFDWVKDGTQVDHIENRTIGRDVAPVEWVFHPIAKRSSHPGENQTILIDGVIFQLQAQRPLGISRVWKNLLPRLIRLLENYSVVLLRRGRYSPEIDGIEEVEIPTYTLGPDEVLNLEDEMLRRICLKYNCSTFISTYYTRAPGFTNILMIHDMIPEAKEFDLHKPEWRSKARAIENANWFLTVSDFTKNELLRYYPGINPSIVTVSHNGISDDFFPADEEEISKFVSQYHIKHPYFLMVGNRGWYKNSDMFFKVLSSHPHRKDYQVLAVGGEPDRIEKEKEKYSGVNINAIPWLADHDMRSAYSGAAALIYLSSYEGFGLPLLEALSCGCPVITTKSAAIPEVCGDSAIYVDPNRPEEIIQAVDCLQHGHFREDLKRRGLIRAKTFDWDSMAENIAEIVKRFSLKKPSNKFSEPCEKFNRSGNCKTISDHMTEPKSTGAFAENCQKSRALVTAIVSTYNAEKFIQGCLKDLETQTISGDLEIVVVDSGSTQNEEDIVRRYQKQYDNIKYIRTESRETVYAAWNRAIKASSGKYITNANTDDRHRHDAFEIMARILEENRDISLVYADVLITETENEHFGNCNPVGVYRWLGWDREKLLYRGCFMGPQPMWRRDVHDEYGYFDETLITSGDYEFWLRISQTRKFFHLPIPLGLYLKSPESIEHRNRQNQNEENLKILAAYRHAAIENRVINKIGQSMPRHDHMPPIKIEHDAFDKIIDDYLKTAEILFQKEYIDDAVDILLKAIGTNPRDGRSYLALAAQLINHGRYEQAVEVLAEIPPDPVAEVIFEKLLLEGYAALGLGHWEDAGQKIDELRKGGCSEARVFNLQGMLVFQRGNIAEAKALFQQAMETDPRYGEPHTNLGIVLWEEGEQKLALDCYEKGFRLSPTDIDIAHAYHEAITAAGELASAEELARNLLEQYPNCRKIRYLFIDALLQQGKMQAALNAMEEAVAVLGTGNGMLDTALAIREKVPSTNQSGKSRKNGVSLCMIVKDEDAHLGRCLASIKPIVDEMIVVDTGSQDRTQDIATLFGAKVYEFEWTGDFAAARNFSLSKATCDWVLIMDADEVISARDYEKFRKLVRKRPKKPIAYAITTRNYCNLANNIGWEPNRDEYPDEEAGWGWLPSTKVRLFYGKKRIRFEGAVHEMVDFVLKREGIAVRAGEFPVHHYGRLDDHRMDRKGEIYYEIGRRKLEESKHDIAAVRELATQATVLARNQEAVDLWSRFLTMSPPQKAAAEAYINLATLYLRMKEYESAKKASEEALSILPDMKEAPYNLALSQLHLGCAEAAAEVLEKLVADYPDYPPAQFVLAATGFILGENARAQSLLEELRKGPFGRVLAQSFGEMARDFEAAGHRNYARRLLQAALEHGFFDPRLLSMQNVLPSTEMSSASVGA